MVRRLGAWRVRRVVVLLCTALVVVSVVMFLTVQVSVTPGGTLELLDGQPDTAPLALPIALFVVGAAGLMAALGWHPGEE